MNIQVNITYTSLYPDIQKHLSVIGKRTANVKGENIFSAITLSSAEKDILSQYIQQAAQNVVAVIERFVSSYTETGTGLAFYVTNTRWNDPNTPSFANSFLNAFHSYLINYTLSEYLSMTFPELAKKYFQAAVNFLQAIVRLVFFKAPPAPSNSEEPSVQAQIVKKAVNIGTDTDPYYDFHVPLTDFTYYDITSVQFSDLDNTDATFNITTPSGNPIVEDISLPHDFTAEELTQIRNAGTDFVKFHPDALIAADDTLMLNYTL